ncbi:hypothetical protein LY15_001711 [Prauserella flava]|uniref:Uncharacterized protein n=1 Tax=Prauserella sediminis TaxID=577680 RepID=A0A839XKJ8_9PSEU|nr:hypothetical protein [Prauserella sediminis]MCR3719737.1 hypothetical protein [Prauserella flava]MCR3736720.1 hypothetical protein [Prauserella salsuginis]
MPRHRRTHHVDLLFGNRADVCAEWFQPKAICATFPSSEAVR